MTHLDGTYGTRCALYGYRSQLQCGKPAVLSLVATKTPVCKKCSTGVLKG